MEPDEKEGFPETSRFSLPFLGTKGQLLLPLKPPCCVEGHQDPVAAGGGAWPWG